MNATSRDAVVAFVATALSRLAFLSEPYFADGPAHIRVIEAKTYLLQPPGYWLFNHTAALFGNARIGIEALNVLFSATGVAVFYLVAIRLMDLTRARLATLLYSVLFFAWFSGIVHSTYPSQLFFPVAAFYCLLRFNDDRRWGYLAALAFGIGAGMRPTDGLFFIPLLLSFAWKHRPPRNTLGPLGLAVVVCLFWLIPTLHGLPGGAGYSYHILFVTSPLAHPNKIGAANIMRVILPLALVFWPLAPDAFRRRRWDADDKLLVWWCAPALLLFLAFYVSDATYLNFVTAPLVLLCVGYAKPSRITLAAVSNAAFFLFARPIPTDRLVVDTFNYYAVRYTLFESRHPTLGNLSDKYH